MKKTVGSMFAGVGGICQGFKDAGFELVWANEMDHQACVTYSHLMNVKYSDKADYLEEGDICETLA